MKICNKCRLLKPLFDFYRNDSKGRLKGRCKECVSEANKLDSAARTARNKLWRELNPEKHRANVSRQVAKQKAKLGFVRQTSAEIQEKRNNWKANDRRELGKYYVASTIKMNLCNAPQQLIELKREQLCLKRLAREMRQASTKSKDQK